MEVLRQNSQTIITILEVLLYDPLYVWTVTSAEANKRQTDDENDLRNMSSESPEGKVLLLEEIMNKFLDLPVIGEIFVHFQKILR